MKRGSLTNIIVYAIVGVVLTIIGVLVFRALVPEPPLPEVEQARAAIARARDLQSEIYSPKLFREAKNNYDSAMAIWQSENDRFILTRDYDRVIRFAEIAEKKAEEAQRNTISRSQSLKSTLESEIARLNNEIAAFEKIFLSMPLPQDVKKKHARGKLLIKEAGIDFKKERYVDGNVKITEANEYISGTYNLARKNLEEYFKNSDNWQDWADETITESKRSGSYAILVEKIPAQLHLYQGGKKKYTFEAEFGSNWLGDKKSRGDMATPEGKYIVTKKLSGSSTKYHKALLINYPNKIDVQEFNERIRNGQLPADASIGDMIEIHGDGGKGGHWTQGCVALKNSDMDMLFKYVSKGTPVTIIGSTLTLEEFFSSRENSDHGRAE
ncbi:MAG TPA: L,D-transpeptidase [Bacteroidales bacterium]|nr:L,D-transpeptidase [Bacteroidales bacterium]